MEIISLKNDFYCYDVLYCCKWLPGLRRNKRFPSSVCKFCYPKESLWWIDVNAWLWRPVISVSCGTRRHPQTPVVSYSADLFRISAGTLTVFAYVFRAFLQSSHANVAIVSWNMWQLSTKLHLTVSKHRNLYSVFKHWRDLRKRRRISFFRHRTELRTSQLK